jgi:hypothetical protein
MVLVLVYYFMRLGLPLLNGDWCISGDFCGYYGAGQVWNELGSSKIYDEDVLGEYQADYFLAGENPREDFTVVSMIYLPIFLLPFRLYALPSLPVGLLLWDLTNLIILVAYFLFFAKKVSGKKLPFLVLGLILISYPVFRNFFDGQVNTLLLISAGEFLRALLSDKPVKAGIWLGGWLLKPQTLILILPFLLFQKKYRALLGFIISSIFILGISYLIVGWEGLLALANVILDSSEGQANSNFQLMMNWRAIAFYFLVIPNPIVSQAIFWVGTIATTIFPFWTFRKKMESNSPEFVVALLGIITATTAVTYHAHHHMAVIIIPCLLYLYLNGWLEKKVFLFWIFAPSLTIMVQYVVKARLASLELPFIIPVLVLLTFCLAMFVPNLVLLGWSIEKGLKWQKDPTLKPAG